MNSLILPVPTPTLSIPLWRYVLAQAGQPLLLTGAVLVLLVWLAQSLRFLDLLVNKGLPFATFLQLTVYLVPFVLMYVLPIAVVIGVAQMCKNLHDRSEFPALFASGLSPSQLAQPLVLIGLLAVFLGYALSLYLFPLGMQSFKSLQHTLRHQQGHLLLETGAFNQLDNGLMIYLQERVGPYGMRGLFVHDSRAPLHPVTWLAQRGSLQITPQGTPRLLLHNGVRQDVTPEHMSSLSFAAHSLELGQPVDLPPERMLGEEERFLTDLDPTLMTDAKLAQEFRAEWHRRLLWPLTPLPLLLLAAGLLLRPRSHRFSLRQPLLVLSLTVILYQILLIVLHAAARDGSTILLYGQWALPGLVSGIGVFLLVRGR